VNHPLDPRGPRQVLGPYGRMHAPTRHLSDTKSQDRLPKSALTRWWLYDSSIVSLFRGINRFESSSSHSSRFTCECKKEDDTLRGGGVPPEQKMKPAQSHILPSIMVDEDKTDDR